MPFKWPLPRSIAHESITTSFDVGGHFFYLDVNSFVTWSVAGKRLVRIVTITMCLLMRETDYGIKRVSQHYMCIYFFLKIHLDKINTITLKGITIKSFQVCDLKWGVCFNEPLLPSAQISRFNTSVQNRSCNLLRGHIDFLCPKGVCCVVKVGRFATDVVYGFWWIFLEQI